MRSHAALTLLFLIAAAATAAFAFQDGVSSVTSDEVSYLALARLFAGGEPWAAHYTTFPPLFPLLLAATGGATDIARAHLVVAACAIAALPLLYRHASIVTGRDAAALGVVAGFLATPSAWIAAKPVLSETAYLAVTMAALLWFETRGSRRPRDRWVLGALLAAAVMVRTAGFALVAAYAARLVREWRRSGERPGAVDAIPVVLPVLAALAWIVSRPMAGVDLYAFNAAGYASRWAASPASTLADAVRALAGGWVATFAIDSGGAGWVNGIVAAFGLLCLWGTWLRLRAGALDAWYVAFMLAAITPVFFGEQTARRYLYPIVPLLLLHSAVAISHMRLRAAGALVAALAAAVSLAALAIAAPRALDAAPVLEGFPIRYRDMADYYTARDVDRARLAAASNAGVLAGFDAIARATPRDARVMWMRPEYVSVLAQRPAAPWFYRDDETRLARAIESQSVAYAALSGIVKTDLAGVQGDQSAVRRALERFARPVIEIPNAVNGQPEFILLEIDRDAVRRYLAGRP